jgi:hypothetical protein
LLRSVMKLESKNVYCHCGIALMFFNCDIGERVCTYVAMLSYPVAHSSLKLSILYIYIYIYIYGTYFSHYHSHHDSSLESGWVWVV